jgi:alpha-glucosidase
VELRERQAPNRQLVVTFRVYDEGVAMAYTVPRQPGLDRVRITAERTEFRFAGDYPAWATYKGQGVYQRVPLSEIQPGCERPLVIEMAGDRYAALAEAKLVDYARMKFAPLAQAPHGLVSRLDGPVEGTAPLTTPWRVVMVAESPGRLVENNFLIPNLNDPCAIADTSWIKPGKAIREGTLTTEGGKACVDFAVKRGLQYVEYDAGWYGPEFDPASDARAVNIDPARKKGPLDLQEVIRYADERGIGIILYVNQRALERQLDELLPLYRQWGVKGLKFGFVNVGSQKWTAWLHEAVRKCAAQRFMVDIHDEYRPTGFSRTYPNLITVEGILGDETSPPNTQTLAYAFTRMLAGPADNTVCYYDKRVKANASHAYQLAKPVCLFSPWQFLFWYDRPPISSSPGAKTNFGDEPELEFYNHLPTTWDDTKVLQGRIGEYALIARRKGDDWFLGFMNSGEARSFAVPLDFLTPGGSYEASVYSDDPSVPTKTNVRIDRIKVTRDSSLELKAGPQGGVAVRIHKTR